MRLCQPKWHLISRPALSFLSDQDYICDLEDCKKETSFKKLHARAFWKALSSFYLVVKVKAQKHTQWHLKLCIGGRCFLCDSGVTHCNRACCSKDSSQTCTFYKSFSQTSLWVFMFTFLQIHLFTVNLAHSRVFYFTWKHHVSKHVSV